MLGFSKIVIAPRGRLAWSDPGPTGRGGKGEDTHRKSNQSFNINASKSSFWKFPIWIGGTLYRQAQRLVLNVGICQMNVRNLRKHMVKTHMNLVI